MYALFLHKGHNKDRTLDSSYRTISTCPLISKGLDIYVRDLYIEKWNQLQADTQYQGEGSSHELASLLITKAIQHSKYVSSKPIFMLFLDAKSAFDTVIIPYLIRQLYFSGVDGSSLLYMDNRLTSRITFCEFDKQLAGPIHDEQGVEQGGVPSSDCYKLYNNELLKQVQSSKLGVDMGSSLVVSGVGQADDTALLSNDIFKLYHLLQLALNYCRKFNVKLSSSKTKLLVVQPAKAATGYIPLNPIKMDGLKVEFSSTAKHVGVIRSTSGNMPNIMQGIASFKRALGSVISCGLARGRRTNPSAAIRILSVYVWQA